MSCTCRSSPCFSVSERASATGSGCRPSPPSLDAGQSCRALTSTGDAAPLLQLEKAGPQDMCDSTMVEPDDGRLLRFQPCGHRISIEAFVQSVNSTFSQGGRGCITSSPITGQTAFHCPMGLPECEKSFLHDTHHYKLCGESCRSLMKEWAAERFAEADEPPPRPPTAASAASASAAAAASAYATRRARTRCAIEEALTRGAGSECPRCGQAGQKDPSCFHVTCGNSALSGPGCGLNYCCASGLRWAAPGCAGAPTLPRSLSPKIIAKSASRTRTSDGATTLRAPSSTTTSSKR